MHSYALQRYIQAIIHCRGPCTCVTRESRGQHSHVRRGSWVQVRSRCLRRCTTTSEQCTCRYRIALCTQHAALPSIWGQSKPPRRARCTSRRARCASSRVRCTSRLPLCAHTPRTHAVSTTRMGPARATSLCVPVRWTWTTHALGGSRKAQWPTPGCHAHAGRSFSPLTVCLALWRSTWTTYLAPGVMRRTVTFRRTMSVQHVRRV